MNLEGTIIPHLVVKGGDAALAFYQAAFGAEVVERHLVEDGRLMHATVKIGNAVMFVCDDMPEMCGGVSRAPAGPSPVTLHLCVPNCDAAVAKAAAAGAAVTMAPEDMFWGDRYGQVQDPFGHAWSFTHPLAQPQAAAA